MKNSLLTICVAFSLVFISSCASEPVVTTRMNPPDYVRPISPGPDYVWIDGDWVYTGRQYTWREGYWIRPGNRHWVRGEWTPRRNGYYWKRGHWRR